MFRRFFCTLLISLLFVFAAWAESDTLLLHRGWTFGPPDNPRQYTATVPGVVQQDLIRHGVLPDPMWGMREDTVQWVGERDWTYRLEFDWDDTPGRFATLELDGLDTYARVMLNGQEILHSENMFVGHRIPVTGKLRAHNELLIHFQSPLRAAMPQYCKSGIDYPADNDHGMPRLSVYTRKAPYHYGWDWGMRLITMGPWRAIRLISETAEVAWHDAPEVRYRLNALRDTAYLEVLLPIENRGRQEQTAQLIWTLRNPEGGVVRQSNAFFSVLPGANQFVEKSVLPNPLLWMPAGWGKPHLYRLEARIISGENDACTSGCSVGFRSVELVREADSVGRSFYFRVNGHPLYARVANYIPGSLMLSTQDDAYYRRFFEDVTDQGMNMLRVWGGGVYEDDRFYAMADSLGILVWQDFMFACTPYPADADFLKNVEREAVYNLRRLCRHPSLAVWCGNNEIREALKYWGWQKKYDTATYQRFRQDYRKLFEELLPCLVHRYDGSRDYIESSPDTANWGRVQTLSLGESHYWGVWYGREPFEVLRSRMPRFMSEFGVQSFPAMSSIRRFALVDAHTVNSAVMKAHQKSSIGNEVIAEYIARYYPQPKDFDRLVYLSQVMQGAGIRLGIEAQRAAAPYCMGSLYWQLNDVWPAVSWSAVDYYGTRKALHYEARRAFRPQIIVPDSMGGSVRVVNGSLDSLPNLTLSAVPIAFDGSTPEVAPWLQVIALPANQVSAAIRIPHAELLPAEQRSSRLICFRLQNEQGVVLAEQLYYTLPPKDLNLSKNPDIQTEILSCRTNGELVLRVVSEQLARSVQLEIEDCSGRWSDNFFDLLPNRPLILHFTPDDKLPANPQIRLRHL